MRDFLGHPIRARIKGTSAQRPSAVSKKPHFYPPVQNVYNGQQPVSTAALARGEGVGTCVYMCLGGRVTASVRIVVKGNRYMYVQQVLYMCVSHCCTLLCTRRCTCIYTCSSNSPYLNSGVVM